MTFCFPPQQAEIHSRIRRLSHFLQEYRVFNKPAGKRTTLVRFLGAAELCMKLFTQHNNSHRYLDTTITAVSSNTFIFKEGCDPDTVAY